MKVVTVIQARTGSTRLPGKINLPLAGSTLLHRMVQRVQAASMVGTVVVATTTDSSDDPVAEACQLAGLNLYRGHPTDLLDRHYQAGRQFGADYVVKIPSDCPLIDPAVIDRVLGWALGQAGSWDYAGNLHPATYPDGNDVEIMTMDALRTAWQQATRPLEREHTTPYLWENPELFRCMNLAWETGLDYSMSHRWTIDYPEDYAFIERVYSELYAENQLFGLNDILALLERKPEIAVINARYAGVNWYRNHLGELKTIDPGQTRQL